MRCEIRFSQANNSGGVANLCSEFMASKPKPIKSICIDRAHQVKRNCWFLVLRETPVKQEEFNSLESPALPDKFSTTSTTWEVQN